MFFKCFVQFIRDKLIKKIEVYSRQILSNIFNEKKLEKPIVTIFYFTPNIKLYLETLSKNISLYLFFSINVGALTYMPK